MATEKFRLRGTKWVIDKDPNAELDYTADFYKFLNPVGDTIVSATVVVTGGLVVDSIEITPTTVVAWLSGGDVTVDGEYASATFRITTDNVPPRIDDRTLFFNILER